MFNLNLWNNKSYYMNFVQQNMSYMPYNLYKKY